MNEFDDRIRTALEGIDEAGVGAFDRIGEAFLKRSRSLMVIGWVKMVLFVVVAGFAAVMFFRSHEPKATTGWAALFVVMSLSLGIGFIIYWLELFRNSVMREIKRLELRVSGLAPDQRK